MKIIKCHVEGCTEPGVFYHDFQTGEHIYFYGFPYDHCVYFCHEHEKEYDSFFWPRFSKWGIYTQFLREKGIKFA